MGNGEKTGYHRAAKAVRESSGSSRAWGVATTIIGGLAMAALLGFVQMRDEVIVSTAWATETAPKWHDATDERLKFLERPELLVRLAQATSAVEKVEEAAEMARENHGAIKVIETQIGHIAEGQERQETMQERILRKLDDLNVRSQ